MEKINHWYLHVDLDAFFASVEQLDHPEYKGKPVIVGGKPEDKRSVVSTASYEARKFGVHSAMPTYQAYKLCPQGIYVYGNMKRYSELSYQIMTIFRDYSPDVDQMSIDEAFIDITGTERLFGPPEETAMKIKAQVKKETGLTVSVGLATTKYLAKIASGFSKPDGFYFVKPGTEQEFMLNLPLDKLWGVGKKGQEKLKNAGLHSTRDIYEKSFETLEFIFGKNTANFLYNIVRGIDVAGFGHEAKKHSISAETTFPDDVSNVYTAQTKLLELCQNVIFRLIRSNEYSRTAFVKIRYDDFSTVSIQQTVDRNILTLDSFFEIIKNLFDKKYEKGRGIRLLGVGLDNIEKTDSPYQQDLFENKKEKNQAVEKAIIKLEKKHPEIKIHKARTLDNKFRIILGFCAALFLLGENKAYAEEPSKVEMKGAGSILTDSTEERPISETSTSLFNWEINDKNNVEFLLSGFWKGSFSNSLEFSFGNGTGFAAGLGLPVFTQEVDISSWILLNQKWYFEADFADNFDKNTIAMGYIGENFLKSARISNRGITMPSNYSANIFGYALTGGNNQAPGVSFHFEEPQNSRWSGDILLRYDMTKTNSATFYGKNSTTDVHLLPENFLYGYSYVFPLQAQDTLFKIKDIYVEKKDGKFKDKNGKKYKKLSTSEYTILHSQSRILFSKSAGTQKSNDKIPTIIITFTEDSSLQTVISATGSYDNPETFAGQIQTYFNSFSQASDSSFLELSKFASPLTTQIENQNGLILQNSILFSPYLCANVYDCGITSKVDLFIQSATTELHSKEYFAQELSNNLTGLSTDFLQEKHLYAQVLNNSTKDLSYQNPAVRFPFAAENPKTYLNLPSSNDFELIVRNYNPVSDFIIGTEAIEGTVQVYINNKLYTGAVYNSELGSVEITKKISDTDKIFITWQEDSSNFSGGALAAGTGLCINFTPFLKADFALTSRWPLSINEHYATADSPISGFAAFSGGISYEKENFTIADKAAVSVNSDNATDNLLVLEQLVSAQTYYLSNSDGYKTLATPFLNGKNPFVLQSDKNCTISSHGGTTDSFITGYKIPLYWDFSGVTFEQAQKAYNNGEPYWASVDVKLTNGNILKKSDSLEVALKIETEDFDWENTGVYLQLGVCANENFSGEDSLNIPLWKINGQFEEKVAVPLNVDTQSWQTVRIILSEEDRAKLASACDARLIIVYEPQVALNNLKQHKGKISFGPYQPFVKPVYTTSDNSILTNAHSVLAVKMPSATSLAIPDNYAAKLSWQVLDSQKASLNSKISAISYFDTADFSSYKTINFDFATTQTGNVTFNLDSDTVSAISLTLNDLSPYISEPDSPVYHTLTIQLPSGQVFIDSNKLEVSEYNLVLNKKIIPNRFALTIDTHNAEELFEKGEFYIGNIYYSENDLFFKAQNYIYTKYETENALLEINSLQSPDSVSGDIYASLTFAGINFNADLNTDLIAGHSLQTQTPLFNFLSFGENYRFNHEDESLNKSDNFSLDFTQFIIPFKFEYETSAKDYQQNRQQNTKMSAVFEKNILESSIGISADYESSQKMNTDKNKAKPFNADNYFYGWYDISSLEFSKGEELADLREQTLTSKLYANFEKLRFNPELSYILQTQYQNLNTSSITDSSTLQLSLPLVLSANSFNFTLSRTGTGNETLSNGGSYFSDAKYIGQSFNSKSWLYTSLPFFDLFDKNLQAKINSSISPFAQTVTYETLYQLTWKRKLTNSLKDFYLPSAAVFAFSRDTKGYNSQSDLYQIKTVLTNTALNCFGSQSHLKLFDWYNQDEFISNITAIVKLPVDQLSSTNYSVSAYEQALFYMENNSILNAGIDFSIENNSDWNTRLTLLWTRPGKTSFIVTLLNVLAPKTTETKFDISRKDILNVSLGQTENLFKQKYEYTHNCDFKFLTYYSITAGCGTYLKLCQNAAANVGFTLTIGAKIEF